MNEAEVFRNGEMMTEPSNWEEMGLTPGTLFKPEALPFWLQYPVHLFIQAIVHEVREELMKIDTYTHFVWPDDPGLDAEKRRFFQNKLTIEQACSGVLRSNEKLKDISNIAWKYAEINKSGSKE